MIVRRPSGFIAPCQPSKVSRPPSGSLWVHEIKHDGYRLIVQREGARVRLFTRRGYDWSDRFPLISEAAKRLRVESFVIDGEAVWLDENGLSHIDRLHSRKHLAEVRLVAFDLLAVGGDDIRSQPLHARKGRLARLLAKSKDGIQLAFGPYRTEHDTIAIAVARDGQHTDRHNARVLAR